MSKQGKSAKSNPYQTIVPGSCPGFCLFYNKFFFRDLKKFTSKQIFKAIKENLKESRKEWMIYMFEKAGKRHSNNKDFQFWSSKWGIIIRLS